MRSGRPGVAAIRRGEVDALVVSGEAGDRVFTLKSADHAYRLLIEQMSEGAVTLAADGTILFCNARFGSIVLAPLADLKKRLPLDVDRRQAATAPAPPRLSPGSPPAPAATATSARSKHRRFSAESSCK